MTIPEITVRNLQRKIRVDVSALQMLAHKAVRCCLSTRKAKRTELSGLPKIFIWLISDRRISRLHQQFLGQTGATDVLTFQHGKIFISVEMARRHARTFGNSLMRELQLYIVHGLLHLHGFDDRTKPGARRMEKLQEKILSDCSAHKPSHTAARV